MECFGFNIQVKYVDQNGLAAILAANRSAGVTPGADLRNQWHVGDEAQKWGNPP